MIKQAITGAGHRKWLVLSLVAMLVLGTAGAQLFGGGSARADLTTSPTIASAPATGNVAPLSTVVYTATAPHALGSGTGTLSIALPAGVTLASSSCTTTATGGTAVNVSPSTSCAVGGTVTAAGTVTLTVNATVNPAANGTVILGATATADDGTNQSTAGPTGSLTVLGTTGSSGPVVALGQEQTITFTLPIGITYCSDASAAGAPRVFNITDQVVVPATAEVSTTSSTELNSAVGTHTVVVDEPSTVTLLTHPVGSAAGEDCTATAVTAAISAGELRHMSDVDLGADVEVIGDQHVLNNVRGSRHVICAVAQNTGIDLNGDGDFTDPGDVPAVALFIPLGAISQINIQSGGGYLTTLDDEPTQTDLQIFVGDGVTLADGGNGGRLGATCFSWVSTGAGDQEINVVYTGADGNPYNVSWDTDGDGNDNDGVGNDGVVNTAAIKEWNVLEASSINGGTPFFTSRTVNGVQTTTGGSVHTISAPAFFNPATSVYQFSDLELTDTFIGSHTTRTGAKVTVPLAGVNWTVRLVSGCGVLDVQTGVFVPATATVPAHWAGTTMLDSDGSVFNNPTVALEAGVGATGCTSLSNQVILRFTGTEPGPLGSGPGVTVTQDVVINLIVALPPVKQVLLAWAGQRVMIEHDWRLPPGDVDGNADGDTTDTDPDPLGVCAFGDDGDDYFLVQHIRGSGPGNFLPGPHVRLNGSDQADATVETENDQDDHEVPFEPWENCISRVIYESEDQGQVDIELFVYGVNDDGCDDNGGCPGGAISTTHDEVPRPVDSNFTGLIDNQTKVAIVIYYMKLNTVNVALVTTQTKGAHHNATGVDFQPGNPWDASTDATTAADWNVSTDILVRGRVTGWFTNSNPSGRPRDDSDPNNVLPADRWVMPTDWAQLQGGACGFECRPEYDYMFAPNNAKGIALRVPEGTSNTQVATVNAGATTSVIPVTTTSQLTPGSSILVGAAATAVLSRTATSITVSPALAAAPAAGTPVFLVGGTPFEGPISLLDIPGLAAAGFGGAALSDFDPNNIKDTILGDGVLDWWDAPMPPTPVWVDINGAGFIKQVRKQDVYWLGAANGVQTYPNAYYITDIPESPFLPARVAGGGFLWDTWGLDGPGGAGQGVYRYWNAVFVGTNPSGSAGQVISAALAAELANARTVYGDSTIARRLTVFSDNHGEFMVIANGDANLTFDDCDTNLFSGGKHCSQGDAVGTSTISATADYPDFRGKHFPVSTNVATVNWTWGGYKEITVEDGETEQFKYIVLHELDRDGSCQGSLGTGNRVSLHSVVGREVDWLIDSDEGGRFVDAAHLDKHDGLGGLIQITNESATTTLYSTAENQATAHGAAGTHKVFDTLHGSAVECQSWVKISNSLLGRTNVFVIAHNPEGSIGFDVILDFTDTIQYTLNFRWSLITWAGADGISPTDALSGTGANAGGTNILSEVTAMYGWQGASQSWLSFFPDGVGVPGVNDLTALQEGAAYWIAIRGPNSITWTVVTNVN